MANNNLKIIQGNDVDIPLHFTDSLNADVDITWCTIFFTVKDRKDKSWDDTNAIISKDVTTHTDAVHGKTTVSLTKTETDKKYWYYNFDIKIKTTLNKYQSCQSWIVQILKSITKRT